MTPRPYCAPTTKPAFFILGITMTHLVPSSTLPGMPLSGASIISFMTCPDSFTRSLSSSPVAAQAEVIRHTQTNMMLAEFFIRKTSQRMVQAEISRKSERLSSDKRVAVRPELPWRHSQIRMADRTIGRSGDGEIGSSDHRAIGRSAFEILVTSVIPNERDSARQTSPSGPLGLNLSDLIFG